jgi:hypothetical protein
MFPMQLFMRFGEEEADSRHTTFCINSLAHWTGLQPYTEEVSAKGNYVSPFYHVRVIADQFSYWLY